MDTTAQTLALAPETGKALEVLPLPEQDANCASPKNLGKLTKRAGFRPDVRHIGSEASKFDDPGGSAAPSRRLFGGSPPIPDLLRRPRGRFAI